MFGTGWGMAKEKRYSCDGNLSFDTSAGKMTITDLSYLSQ